MKKKKEKERKNKEKKINYEGFVSHIIFISPLKAIYQHT